MTATNKNQTVAATLRLIDAGQDVSGIEIDFSHIKVEALDAMKLAKNGISVPEEAIYYDNDNIILDEDETPLDQLIPLAKDPADELLGTFIRVHLDEDTTNWVKRKGIHLDRLATELVKNFYRTHQAITEGD
jgi:hypothetical protein